MSLKAMYIYEMKYTRAEVYELVSGTNNGNTWTFIMPNKINKIGGG